MMDDQEKKARIRVRKMRNFYSSLITYILINILLLIINLIFSPHSLWFYWVTIIWGFFIIVQAFNTFTIRDRFLGDQWEDDQVRKILDKDKKK